MEKQHEELKRILKLVDENVSKEKLGSAVKQLITNMESDSVKNELPEVVINEEESIFDIPAEILPSPIGNWVFVITEEQRKQIHEWDKCKGKYAGAIGGRLSYTFTPTSIGETLTVVCSRCKEELSFRDF
ncbi:hypothetical protein [Bacillus cereus]|uniref:Uncharacterized protein n=1 Tax=Bacillus cereus TaxID=1396 RepID=A0A164NYU6_BACCE|nr:hypothetical protein [Bacillus cereus]KZD66007.1 hypothetical protein B4088_2764 [Bacillus cereus]